MRIARRWKKPMINTLLPLTLMLAKAIGVLAIAAGIGALLNPRRWTEIVDGLRREAALTYVTGAFTFALGATMIMVHNVWTDVLAVVVTLIGWLAAIEGLILIVAPAPFLSAVDRLVRPGPTRIWAIVAIVFGAVLLLLGVTGRAGPVL